MVGGGRNHLHTSALKKGHSMAQNGFKSYILWPPENVRQIRHDRDFRLQAILLISDFFDPNFSNGHKIVTIGARDLNLFLK